MVNNSSLYTVGHGNRQFEEFKNLLKRYEIKFVIDVRSKPYSSYRPEFNREPLEAGMSKFGIKYVFMGDLLGGQPENRNCYTNGRVDYKKLKDQPSFKRGLERLKVAWEKGIPVAIMCSESKPENCHRTKLIGQELVKWNINTIHIDEKGDLVSQDEAIFRLTGGQETMFSDPEVLSFSGKRLDIKGGD